jgi:hypothetical protein
MRGSGMTIAPLHVAVALLSQRILGFRITERESCPELACKTA